jgi:DnaD/phage-associated family protein
MSQKKKVQGIWIPIEIWESDELRITEKVLLAEVKSFENKKEACFASNKHFADFLGLKPSSVANMIGDLVKRGFLNRKIKYKNGTKQIERRYLRVTNKYYPVYEGSSKNEDPLHSNVNTPSYLSDPPLHSNVKGTNTRTTKQITNVVVNKRNAFTVFEQSGFGLLSGTIINNINIWIDDFKDKGSTEQEADELVSLALTKADENGVRRWNYAHAILKNWLNKGFTKPSDVEAHEKQREQSQEMKTEEGKPDLSWEEELDNL